MACRRHRTAGKGARLSSVGVAREDGSDSPRERPRWAHEGRLRGGILSPELAQLVAGPRRMVQALYGRRRLSTARAMPAAKVPAQVLFKRPEWAGPG
jgi:hypothetical protein